MTMIELIQKVYQALIDSLNPTDAILFLQQMGWGKRDYTQERESNLKQVSREEFWEDIQKIRARKQ